jgi:YidC/Oxa1 family membrane protein insertase
VEYRRLLIAALLSFGVILLWQTFVAPPTPPRPSAPSPQAGAPTPQASAPKSEGPAAPAEPQARTGPTPTPEAQPAEPQPTPPPEVESSESVAASAPTIAADNEERVTLENDRVRAIFSNRGAQLVSFELKHHRDGDNGAVNLVHGRATGPYPFALVGTDGSSSKLDEALFTVERGEGQSVTFRFRGSAGGATKTFVLKQNGLLHFEVSAESASEWAVLVGPGLRDLPPSELNNRFTHRQAVWLDGGDLSTSNPHKAKEAQVLSGGVRWVGLEDNYFLDAVLPSGRLDRVVLAPYLMVPGEEEGAPTFQLRPPDSQITDEQDDLPQVFGIWLVPTGNALSADAYLGMKRYDTLRALPGGLQKTVMPGMLGVLARPLLWGLNWMYEHIVPNYGWAIILMTLLIKLLLFPLTQKSFVSMQKMQELNPKIQAIRAKYRSKKRDKKGKPNLEAQRQMNDEVMALYKEHGVNPAGGCLPMLLQLPILFAFYRLLYSAVELRGAPWLLWIKDLSTYDPYFVLPIVMGVSQFIQQKITPSAGNPMQRRMFMLMPVFFTVLFLKFPSGLVLYWLVNNLLTIGQQMMIRRMHEGKSGPQTQGAS